MYCCKITIYYFLFKFTVNNRKCTVLLILLSAAISFNKYQVMQNSAAYLPGVDVWAALKPVGPSRTLTQHLSWDPPCVIFLVLLVFSTMQPLSLGLPPHSGASVSAFLSFTSPASVLHISPLSLCLFFLGYLFNFFLHLLFCPAQPSYVPLAKTLPALADFLLTFLDFFIYIYISIIWMLLIMQIHLFHDIMPGPGVWFISIWTDLSTTVICKG